jgi:hypothetical protein
MKTNLFLHYTRIQEFLKSSFLGSQVRILACFLNAFPDLEDVNRLASCICDAMFLLV